jgi:hypothetical protein
MRRYPLHADAFIGKQAGSGHVIEAVRLQRRHMSARYSGSGQPQATPPALRRPELLPGLCAGQPASSVVAWRCAPGALRPPPAEGSSTR